MLATTNDATYEKNTIHKDLERLNLDHMVKVLRERPELEGRIVTVRIPHLGFIASKEPICLDHVMQAPGMPKDAVAVLSLMTVDASIRFIVASESFDRQPEGRLGPVWTLQVREEGGGRQSFSLIPEDDAVEFFTLSLDCDYLDEVTEATKDLDLEDSVGRILNSAEAEWVEGGKAFWVWVNPRENDCLLLRRWKKDAGLSDVAEMSSGKKLNRKRIEEGECSLQRAFGWVRLCLAARARDGSNSLLDVLLTQKAAASPL